MQRPLSARPNYNAAAPTALTTPEPVKELLVADPVQVTA